MRSFFFNIKERVRLSLSVLDPEVFLWVFCTQNGSPLAVKFSLPLGTRSRARELSESLGWWHEVNGDEKLFANAWGASNPSISEAKDVSLWCPGPQKTDHKAAFLIAIEENYQHLSTPTIKKCNTVIGIKLNTTINNKII